MRSRVELCVGSPICENNGIPLLETSTTALIGLDKDRRTPLSRFVPTRTLKLAVRMLAASTHNPRRQPQAADCGDLTSLVSIPGEPAGMYSRSSSETRGRQRVPCTILCPFPGASRFVAPPRENNYIFDLPNRSLIPDTICIQSPAPSSISQSIFYIYLLRPDPRPSILIRCATLSLASPTPVGAGGVEESSSSSMNFPYYSPSNDLHLHPPPGQTVSQLPDRSVHLPNFRTL